MSMFKKISSMIKKDGKKGDTIQGLKKDEGGENGKHNTLNNGGNGGTAKVPLILTQEYEAGSPVFVGLHMNISEIPNTLYVGGEKSQLYGDLCENPSLNVLILDFNKFTVIPDSVTLFTNLKELSIAANQIKTLPESLVQLKTLEILQVGLNPLEAFPSVICNITTLTTLNLESNGLVSLPKEFSNLTKLKSLSLVGNNLNSIPDHLPAGIDKLNLSCNEISMIANSSTLIQLAPSLTHLDLSENQLDIIDPSFTHLSNLKTLLLGCNHISELPGDVVKGWKSIETLNVPHNNLSVLPPEMLALKTLKVLDIRGNPFPNFKGIAPDVSSFSMFNLMDFIDKIQYQLFQITLMTEEMELLTNGESKESTPNTSTNSVGSLVNGENTGDINNSTNGNNTESKSKKDQYPIIVWQSIIPDKIVDGLYLGCRECSIHKNWLKENNVTHILTIAQFKPLYPSLFKYKTINIEDVDYANIGQYFKETNEFIEDAISQGGGVIVHCRAGVSRSASAVIAYIMNKKKLGYEDAFGFVMNQRPRICPNNGFRLQLREYDLELKKQQTN